MPTVGELFRTEPITWRGKSLVLARPSFATEAAYRTYLQNEALQAIRAAGSSMGAGEYKLHASAWQQDCAAHVYDYATEAWNRSMDSRVNSCRWFWFVFNQAGPDGRAPVVEAVTLGEMDDLWREKGAEIAEAWQRLMAPVVASPDATTDPTKPAGGEPTPAAVQA
jgi:hypothetical protein